MKEKVLEKIKDAKILKLLNKTIYIFEFFISIFFAYSLFTRGKRRRAVATTVLLAVERG